MQHEGLPMASNSERKLTSGGQISIPNIELGVCLHDWNVTRNLLMVIKWLQLNTDMIVNISIDIVSKTLRKELYKVVAIY